MQPVGAHLVGSVPLADERAVFTSVVSRLGSHVCRIPDGETGERTNWVAWQLPVLMRCAALTLIESRAGYGQEPRPQIGIAEGCAAQDVRFDSLGYAAAARASYATFAALKASGEVPAHCRFQVCLPTPMAPIHLFVRLEDQAVVEPHYEAALLGELDQILAAIPPDQLALQWDTAVEFGILEECFPSYLADPMGQILDALERLGNRVPDEVELGFHLCYGDAGHEHFVEPKDMRLLVEVGSGVARRLRRRLNWLHMPVPKDRDDEIYFAPLRSLELDPATEVYLGLVHHGDGDTGARRRIEAARSALPRFGVATECGFGRRPTETVVPLLDLHARVSAPRR